MSISIQKSDSPSPIQLVKRLEEHQEKALLDPTSYMVFKETKRALKDLAKKGELEPELRARVLSILTEKGLRARRNDPKVRGCEVLPTRILLKTPRLWQILYQPDLFPAESALINSLNKDVFECLINDEYMSVEDLDLIRVTSQLNIPDLENRYRKELFDRMESDAIWDIRLLYKMATIWPENEESSFSKVLMKNFKDIFPEDFSSQEVAAEFDRINKMENAPDLPAQTLYRYFLFVLYEGKGALQVYCARVAS